MTDKHSAIPAMTSQTKEIPLHLYNKYVQQAQKRVTFPIHWFLNLNHLTTSETNSFKAVEAVCRQQCCSGSWMVTVWSPNWRQRRIIYAFPHDLFTYMDLSLNYWDFLPGRFSWWTSDESLPYWSALAGDNKVSCLSDVTNMSGTPAIGCPC